MSVNNVTRQIVSHYKTTRQITMVLADCGHQVSRKLSEGLPKTNRVRCRACTALANGANVRTNNHDGTSTIWGWDYETDLPLLIEIAPSTEQPQ